MIIRTLLAVNLILSAGLLGHTLAVRLTDLADSGHYQRLAQAADADRAGCELSHRTLLRNIQREGLWRRLGLNAQPWLTEGTTTSPKYSTYVVP